MLRSNAFCCIVDKPTRVTPTVTNGINNVCLLVLTTRTRGFQNLLFPVVTVSVERIPINVA